MNIEKNKFGITREGECVFKYTLENDRGTSITLSEFGASILSLITRDKYGNHADIVCGYDELDGYVSGNSYQGAIAGRVANRIKNAEFVLDGVKYTLSKNDNVNSLHGGNIGFSHKVWKSECCMNDDSASVTFSLFSPDGDEGYPGNLDVSVTYTLDNKDTLNIHYTAQTDKKTVVNLTNHSYFDLSGYDNGSILDHELQINADRFIPTDELSIPTGEIMSVDGTPFDFRESKTVGRDINSDNIYLKRAGGYDHCLVFSDDADVNSPKVRLYDKKSGRILTLYTDMPAIQLYTGNFLCEEKHRFKGGCMQKKQMALCLETQFMPDSPNHDDFTDCTLDPSQKYDHFTTLKFSVS